MANLIVLNRLSATATLVDIVAPASLENGHIVKLGTQASTKEYACAANAAVSDSDLALVIAVPLSYGVETLENDYVIATGEVVRAVIPYKGLTVSIPQVNITATVALAAGTVVVPKIAVTKMECLAAAVGTESVVFEIDELYTKSGIAMAKIRCIKA
ncbi:MAG: hypothetical protein PHX62_06265 [Bacilli bacterium]|nr:hypothetical protein [Bacilli bacterium]